MIIDKSKKFPEFFDKKNQPRKIDFLVLHHVEASSADHAVEQFKQHQVSSHFLIDESGKIFELIDENDVAYHAGVSFWRGFESLNKNSIGIEFINSRPFEKKFEMLQMQAGVELCKYLIEKYKIEERNIVGHSDIAYHSPTTFLQAQRDLLPNQPKPVENSLDRKQDPSHLFDWKFLAKNGIGIFPEISLTNNQDKKLFELGNKDSEILQIKETLKKFGYKVANLNEEFDLEMQALTRVFNRRFNTQKFTENPDIWYLSSQMAIDQLTNVTIIN